MTAPETTPPKPKRVSQDDIENIAPGRAGTLWALLTAHELEDVLRPGYLNPVREHAFRVGDRVMATVGPQPEFVDLVVVDVHPKRDVLLRLMKQAETCVAQSE